MEPTPPRRAQRKAHLFWKNIIRTRARREPLPRSLLAGTCIPVCARAHPPLRGGESECNWSGRCVFRRDHGGPRKGNPPRDTDCRARESDEKSST